MQGSLAKVSEDCTVIIHLQQRARPPARVKRQRNLHLAAVPVTGQWSVKDAARTCSRLRPLVSPSAQHAKRLASPTMLASTAKNTQTRHESSQEKDIATANAPTQRMATATPGRRQTRDSQSKSVAVSLARAAEQDEQALPRCALLMMNFNATVCKHALSYQLQWRGTEVELPQRAPPNPSQQDQ